MEKTSPKGKNDRKIERKLKKHQHTVTKETAVKCSDDATKILAICNAGQVNGLTEETILEAFERYGDLEQVVLVPGKSCSFIRFKELTSAIQAFGGENGRLKIAQDDKPAFLSFIETLPDIKESKTWNTLPPGLMLINDFITEDEEENLLSLYKFDDHSDQMKHRQVKHYGYEFRYDINNVDKDKPLPEKIPKECDFLWERLNDRILPRKDFNPDQLTINCYKPGQGIPSHIDTHSAFEDPIVSLSLGSPVVMEFKRDEDTYCLLLPRRSLCVMADESRYDWSHGITPKKYDFYYTGEGCKSFKRGKRVSFTFRKILKGDCYCDFKRNCDSYAKRLQNMKIDDFVASQLEEKHVHDVYEDIAGHFSDTRHKPWPNVLDFVQSLNIGSVLVDVGCGNGKYFGHNKQIFEIGFDRSFKLNEVCKERKLETFTSNCLNIPLKDESADGVLSIAVIHHLATEERRSQALREITRILRKRGRALIYVWAKDQVKNQEKSSYIKQDRKRRKPKNETVAATKEEVSVADGVSLPVHVNRTDFNHSDLLVPWKLKKHDNRNDPPTFLRFYHVFEHGELEKVCESIPHLSVVKSYYDQGNYCVIFEKN